MSHKIVDYRPEVDGLRTVAVMAVIFYHAGLGYAPGGFVGVDIFFVISGYLITSIIHREIGEGRFSFITFYERRIRRIFPALFAVLALSIPAAWVLLTPIQLNDFSQSIIATVAFASNFYFRIKSRYFSADAETIPLLHMWSLAVEEQFYIGFPILLIAVRYIKGLSLNAVLIAGCAGSLGYCIYKQPLEPMGAFFLAPSRAWELSAGALVATNRPRILAWLAGRPGLARMMEMGGALMMTLPIFVYSNVTPFPGAATIPPVLGAALIILASRGTGVVGGTLASRPFVFIGLISYSAYLWHQPLFAFARAWSVTHIPLWGSLCLVGLTLLMAWLSWRFVEQPFRSRDGFSRRQIYGLAAVLSVILIALGLIGHLQKGFPGRYNAQVLALAATTEPSPDRTRCHTDGLNYRRPADACRYIGKEVHWAIFGDSHVIETGYALAEHLAPKGQGVVHLSFSGCQPVLTFATPNPGCNAWMKESVAYLEQDRSITDVMVAFRHSFYLFGDQTKSYPTVPNTPPNFLTDQSPGVAREAYWRDYVTILRRLSASGKHVHVVLPLPELPVLVDRYIYRDGGENASTPLDYYARRNAFVLARLDQLRAIPGLTLLDPRDAVCADGTCRAIIDGKAMYFDDNHFSMPAARRFIAAQVAKGLLP
jgi:peptidoglycan/LPS O-acetylase OafA/YrhL